ncbi:polyamine ABC transporter substrate-binding protein [Vallicoccus soli]|uniref:Spermidine/putrescine ABC transporter substrate-binding protein n=1 Tax=Vallicoccus soli TaxID=2339232 RepID=A0A3A3ZN93_9ACTN|nr:spermidine/putrescine ABC transporter substrate-binding protein [Vallicoccus soli]RJK98285.1 spermidine/putrescine ABC transporter substrate-binding protein [Vallicoccus soli]
MRDPHARPQRGLPPLPPALAGLPLSRRRFLRGAAAGGAALAGSGLLAACGTEGTAAAPQDQAAQDRSDTDKRLTVSNWPLYIDVDEADPSKRPTLEAFTAETGIEVDYTEDVNDNNEFFGKVRPQLSAGQDTGRDVVVLTDWMAGRLIRLNWVQELDKDNLPQVTANLLGALEDPGFDPGRRYSVPWQSGLTGIAYNAALTGEVRTVDELLTRPDLKGKVTALSEMRDTMLLVLRSLDKDPTDFTDDDFAEAVDKLQRAVDSGQIRRFTGNEYAQDLAAGNIAACVAWSGDVIQLQLENPDIKFVAPEEGMALFSDNMLVPNRAQHKKNAERFMDHYYDPAVAAQLAAWVNYICPVEGAQAEMEKIDPALAENPLIFPTQEQLSQAYVFRSLSEDEERSYEDQFQKVIGA